MHSFALSRLLFWFTIFFHAALALQPWVEVVSEGRQGLPREITPRGKLAAGEQTTIAGFEATKPSAEKRRFDAAQGARTGWRSGSTMQARLDSTPFSIQIKRLAMTRSGQLPFLGSSLGPVPQALSRGLVSPFPWIRFTALCPT